MKLFMVVICIVTGGLHGFSQTYNSIWYLGVGAKLDFRSSPPQFEVDADASAFAPIFQESSVSVSDADGQFLFFSEGINVYGRDLNITPNGANLVPNLQGDVYALPFQNDPTKFFLFTVEGFLGDPTQPRGRLGTSLSYSVFDITLNGGLGDVLPDQKDILIKDSLTHHVILAQGDDNIVYIVAHESFSDKFFAYPIVDDEILEPVISAVGQVFDPYDGHETKMIYDPSQSLLCLDLNRLTENNGSIEIYCFDPATGLVGPNFLIVDRDIDTRSASTFSPDGQKLYQLQGGELFQFDISDLRNYDVRSDKRLVATFESDVTRSISIGPDDRIYFNLLGDSFIHVINSPNLDLEDINLEYRKYQYPETSTLSNSTLPVPIVVDRAEVEQPEVPVVFSMDTLKTCLGEATLSLAQECKDRNPLWSTNESGLTIRISQSGYYWVEIEWTFCELIRDSIYVDLEQDDVYLDHPREIESCESTYQLNLPDTYNYVWDDGFLGKGRVFQLTGLYYFTVLNQCGGSFADSIFVKLGDVGSDFVGDTLLCNDMHFVISAPVVADSYLWSTDDMSNSTNIGDAGTYWLEILQGTCIYRDSFVVRSSDILLDLGADTSLCLADTLTIELESHHTYHWSDGNTESMYSITSEGQYIVQAIDTFGCTTSDTIEVVFQDAPFSEMILDTLICPSQVLEVALSAEYSYMWPDGSSGNDYLISEAGETLVIIDDGSCTYTSIILVGYDESECVEDGACELYIPNVLSPRANEERNSKFSIESSCDFAEYRLDIYDRWGGHMFHSTEPDTDWSIISSDQSIASGVYVYRLTYSYLSSAERVDIQVGTLTVL